MSHIDGGVFRFLRNNKLVSLLLQLSHYPFMWKYGLIPLMVIMVFKVKVLVWDVIKTVRVVCEFVGFERVLVLEETTAAIALVLMVGHVSGLNKRALNKRGNVCMVFRMSMLVPRVELATRLIGG